MRKMGKPRICTGLAFAGILLCWSSLSGCQFLPSPTPTVEPSITPSPSASSNFPNEDYWTFMNSYYYNWEVVAGTGQKGSVDGPADKAQFQDVYATCLDPNSQELYILERNLVRKLTPAGQVLTLAGSQEAGFKDGKAQDARFNLLVSCTVDQEGKLYLFDLYNYRIRTLDTQGEVSTLLGTGKPEFKDGPLESASLESLGNLAFFQGKLIFSDRFRLRQIENGQVKTLNLKQSSYAESGIYSSEGALYSLNGSIEQARFGETLHFYNDRDQVLFIADRQLRGVVKITPNWQLSLLHFPDQRYFLEREKWLQFPRAIFINSLDQKPYVFVGNSFLKANPEKNEDAIDDIFLFPPNTKKYTPSKFEEDSMSYNAKAHLVYLFNQDTHQVIKIDLTQELKVYPRASENDK